MIARDQSKPARQLVLGAMAKNKPRARIKFAGAQLMTEESVEGNLAQADYHAKSRSNGISSSSHCEQLRSSSGVGLLAGGAQCIPR